MTTRGKLQSMRVSDAFRAFALDQLSGVCDLHSRAMFGGIGLYAADIFFGLIAADRVYLKVDERNRRDYEAARMRPFKPYADRAMTMPYFEVPVHVFEDAATLTEWARTSIDVAKASQGGKKPRSSPARAPKRSPR